MQRGGRQQKAARECIHQNVASAMAKLKQQRVTEVAGDERTPFYGRWTRVYKGKAVPSRENSKSKSPMFGAIKEQTRGQCTGVETVSGKRQSGCRKQSEYGIP